MLVRDGLSRRYATTATRWSSPTMAQEALTLAASVHPDLLLLDLEFRHPRLAVPARHARGTPIAHLRDMPVLLLTATEDEQRGRAWASRPGPATLCTSRSPRRSCARASAPGWTASPSRDKARPRRPTFGAAPRRQAATGGYGGASQALAARLEPRLARGTGSRRARRTGRRAPAARRGCPARPAGPWSSTRITSAARIVLRRWAMTRLVRPCHHPLQRLLDQRLGLAVQRARSPRPAPGCAGP